MVNKAVKTADSGKKIICPIIRTICILGTINEFIGFGLATVNDV